MPVETENLNLKITKTDKAALRQLSRIEGEAMAVLVRRVLRNELERVGLLRPITLNPESKQGEGVAQ